MADIIVYEKRSCSTCRRLFELLTERGVDFERVQYHVEGIDEERIRELLGKAGISAREALRVKEPLVARLDLARDDIGDDELIALMAEHPELLQRPIIEVGERAVLARPVERVLELLDG